MFTDVRCCGFKIHTYFWFVLSGTICDVFQALIDYVISLLYVWEVERATVCWTLSYTISVFIRHYSHRILVFGEFEGTYCNSLSRTYMAYSSSIALSMITNHLIISFLYLTHKQAWLITMLWTGIYNYFVLKSSWKSKKLDSSINNTTINSGV